MNRQNKEKLRKEQLELLKMTPIDNFFGTYRFLSNFFPAVVWFEGLMFHSTEAAYQAAKTLDLGLREAFTGMTPREAKIAGNQLDLREDWEEVRETVMLELLKQKFQNDLLKRLKATAPRPLIEGNTWHDTFWGVCNGKCKQGPHAPTGKNRLGESLMLIRDGYIQGIK